MNEFLLAVATVAEDETVRRTVWEWLLMVAGGITVMSGAAVIVWKVAIKHHVQEFIRQQSEVHRSVTVNGGKSSPPTMLDKVHATSEKVDALARAMKATGERASDLGDKVDLLTELVQDTRDDLQRHEESGRKYLGQVEIVLRDKGIELPPAE